MNAIVNSPLFGILLSLMAFEAGVLISRKWKHTLLNPLLIANILIVGFLLLTGISFESYNVGGSYISVMLSPATIVLAVPLYRQLSKLIGLGDTLMLSLLPKSITIPMGSVVSEQIGGIPSITIIAITITGITGAVAAPAVCRFCRIKHKVAQGVAIGTASHALGTSKAMEMGEVQGAMSSLSIGVAGLFTAITAPLILAALS